MGIWDTSAGVLKGIAGTGLNTAIGGAGWIGKQAGGIAGSIAANPSAMMGAGIGTTALVGLYNLFKDSRKADADLLKVENKFNSKKFILSGQRTPWDQTIKNITINNPAMQMQLLLLARIAIGIQKGTQGQHYSEQNTNTIQQYDISHKVDRRSFSDKFIGANAKYNPIFQLAWYLTTGQTPKGLQKIYGFDKKQFKLDQFKTKKLSEKLGVKTYDAQVLRKSSRDIMATASSIEGQQTSLLAGIFDILNKSAHELITIRKDGFGISSARSILDTPVKKNSGFLGILAHPVDSVLSLPGVSGGANLAKGGLGVLLKPLTWLSKIAVFADKIETAGKSFFSGGLFKVQNREQLERAAGLKKASSTDIRHAEMNIYAAQLYTAQQSLRVQLKMLTALDRLTGVETDKTDIEHAARQGHLKFNEYNAQYTKNDKYYGDIMQDSLRRIYSRSMIGKVRGYLGVLRHPFSAEKVHQAELERASKAYMYAGKESAGIGEILPFGAFDFFGKDSIQKKLKKQGVRKGFLGIGRSANYKDSYQKELKKQLSKRDKRVAGLEAEETSAAEILREHGRTPLTFLQQLAEKIPIFGDAIARGMGRKIASQMSKNQAGGEQHEFEDVFGGGDTTVSNQKWYNKFFKKKSKTTPTKQFINPVQLLAEYCEKNNSVLIEIRDILKRAFEGETVTEQTKLPTLFSRFKKFAIDPLTSYISSSWIGRSYRLMKKAGSNFSDHLSGHTTVEVKKDGVLDILKDIRTNTGEMKDLMKVATTPNTPGVSQPSYQRPSQMGRSIGRSTFSSIFGDIFNVAGQSAGSTVSGIGQAAGGVASMIPYVGGLLGGVIGGVGKVLGAGLKIGGSIFKAITPIVTGLVSTVFNGITGAIGSLFSGGKFLLSLGSSILGKIFSPSTLFGIGGLFAAITGGTAAYAGWKNAADITGKPEPTTLEKIGSGMAGLVSKMSFGMLKPKQIYKFMEPAIGKIEVLKDTFKDWFKDTSVGIAWGKWHFADTLNGFSDTGALDIINAAHIKSKAETISGSPSNFQRIGAGMSGIISSMTLGMIPGSDIYDFFTPAGDAVVDLFGKIKTGMADPATHTFLKNLLPPNPFQYFSEDEAGKLITQNLGNEDGRPSTGSKPSTFERIGAGISGMLSSATWGLIPASTFFGSINDAVLSFRSWANQKMGNEDTTDNFLQGITPPNPRKYFTEEGVTQFLNKSNWVSPRDQTKPSFFERIGVGMAGLLSSATWGLVSPETIYSGISGAADVVQKLFQNSGVGPELKKFASEMGNNVLNFLSEIVNSALEKHLPYIKDMIDAEGLGDFFARRAKRGWNEGVGKSLKKSWVGSGSDEEKDKIPQQESTVGKSFRDSWVGRSWVGKSLDSATKGISNSWDWAKKNLIETPSAFASTGSDSASGRLYNQSQVTQFNSNEYEDAKKLIKIHEGFRSNVYPDKDATGKTLGYSVGIGHFLGTSPSLLNQKFSNSELTQMFNEDFQKHAEAASKIPGWNNLNKTGQAAIIDMTFNMGPAWFNKWNGFKNALAHSDADGMVKSMKDSDWYNQVSKDRSHQLMDMIKHGLKNDKSGESYEYLAGIKGAFTGTDMSKYSEPMVSPSGSTKSPRDQKNIDDIGFNPNFFRDQLADIYNGLATAASFFMPSQTTSEQSTPVSTQESLVPAMASSPKSAKSKYEKHLNDPQFEGLLEDLFSSSIVGFTTNVPQNFVFNAALV